MRAPFPGPFPDGLPTGRKGRVLALGLGFGVLALLWFALAVPLLGLFADQAADLGERDVLARRMAGLAATLPDLRQHAAAIGAGGPAPSALLQGGTDAIASAALQQRVQDLAAQAGATLSSTETLPVASVGGYRRIGLRVSVSASFAVLVSLLQSIGHGPPRMLVDDLQISGVALLIHPADPPLDGQFVVFAFREEGGR